MICFPVSHCGNEASPEQTWDERGWESGQIVWTVGSSEQQVLGCQSNCRSTTNCCHPQHSAKGSLQDLDRWKIEAWKCTQPQWNIYKLQPMNLHWRIIGGEAQTKEGSKWTGTGQVHCFSGICFQCNEQGHKAHQCLNKDQSGNNGKGNSRKKKFNSKCNLWLWETRTQGEGLLV